MRRVVAVVPVHLADVRGPVLVCLTEPLPGFLLGGDVEAGHDRLDPYLLSSAEEDVKGAGELAQDVGAATADDDHIPGPSRLLDHVLGDLEDRLAGVERGSGVGRGPGGCFG